jgi:AraC-like DNA-binding protein
MDSYPNFSYGEENSAFYFNRTSHSTPSYKQNHTHDNFEIYYLLSGERVYSIRKKSYVVVPGCLIFVKSHVAHHSGEHQSPGHERVIINFHKSFLTPLLGSLDFNLFTVFDEECPIWIYNTEQKLQLESQLQKIEQECKTNQLGHQYQLRSLLVEFMLMSQRLNRHHFHGVKEWQDGSLEEKISNAINFIHQNYFTPLTLVSLSEHFSLSPSYMSRSFKKVTGFTFIGYLQVVRIQRAKKLLLDTNHKIIYIAESAGFDSIAHFGRVFKAMEKCTPREYRHLNQVSFAK